MIVIIFLLPGFTGAVTEKDFEAETTQDIVNLYTASTGNPLYQQAINMFIEWVRARPQHWQEKPVETESRFLTEKWPCK